MARYRDAVHWIACNDAPGDDDNVQQLSGAISVLLVADVWGKTAEAVALDVLNFRTYAVQQGLPPFGSGE